MARGVVFDLATGEQHEEEVPDVRPSSPALATEKRRAEALERLQFLARRDVWSKDHQLMPEVISDFLTLLGCEDGRP